LKKKEKNANRALLWQAAVTVNGECAAPKNTADKMHQISTL
jgi:hypothetical protein